MTDAGRDHHDAPKGPGATASLPSPTAAVFTVVLLSGLAAAGAAYGLGDLLGLGLGAVLAIAGAFVATYVSSKSAPPDVKAIALLEAVSAADAPATPPSRFRGEPWATLYAQAVGSAEAQRTATLAVQEVETLRKQLEEKGGAPAFVPSPSHREEELVGTGERPGTADEPSAPVLEPSAMDEPPAAVPPPPSYDRAAVLRELEETLQPMRRELSAIERDLEPVVASLHAGSAPGSAVRDSSAAQMVDALVQTAADGIEDLAAGLMRASELAGVAERVTNRATLLALNAALEATRSGSEAFASIAEETRRLAEYAREATDTISRLSNEIEIKVGETISSIQSSSEDAKAAVASMGGSSAPARGVAPETAAALQTLLARVRALRERTSGEPESPATTVAARPVESPEPEAADVQVDYVEADERPVVPPSESYEPPAESQPAYGSIAFGEPEPPASTIDPSASAEPAPIELAGFGAPPEPAPEAEPTSDENESSEPADTPETPAPSGDAAPHVSDPATLILPKIPDWLEGIEPRHRS